jgi:COP9 signalosome complex subunit 4
LLAMLCKDERSTKLPIYNMLQKIYLERVVRAPEIEQFQKVRDCRVLSVCLSV